jgi:RimJ/RimL family protein N-acetyltransferase
MCSSLRRGQSSSRDAVDPNPPDLDAHAHRLRGHSRTLAQVSLYPHVIRKAIPYPKPPLATERFVLRPFRVDDFDIANEVGEDPSTARWVNALPSSDGAGVVRFNESKRRGGSMLDLVIADRISDAYLGEILLLSREWQAGELAYVVAPFARGRGIATDALKLLSRWAFDQLGLQRLQLKADPDNAASQRVAEKAGYQREGLLRSSFVVRGRRSDSVLYSRLPTDASP